MSGGRRGWAQQSHSCVDNPERRRGAGETGAAGVSRIWEREKVTRVNERSLFNRRALVATASHQGRKAADSLSGLQQSACADLEAGCGICQGAITEQSQSNHRAITGNALMPSAIFHIRASKFSLPESCLAYFFVSNSIVFGPLQHRGWAETPFCALFLQPLQ
eukprot:3723826-Rhodomonas_salina.1